MARALGLVVLLPLLAWAGTELHLRLTIHPPPELEGFFFAHPPLAQLRVTIRPGVVAIPPRETTFTTNALGLRGDELDLTDRSKLRVLTLGDSVTECLLLSDDESWPHRLQVELARRLGREVWVGNAARSGEMVSDYAAHMRMLVPIIAPDLIVIIAGGHDFQAALEESLIPVSFDDPAKLAAFGKNLYVDANLEALEASYVAFMWNRREHVSRIDMTDFYKRMRLRRTQAAKLPELPDLEDALDVYSANLDSLVEGYRRLPKGTALLLATHPSLWRAELSTAEQQTLWGGYTCMECASPEYYGHAALAKGMRTWNDTLLATCASARLPCLDLDRNVDKQQGNFYDDAHMGEAGARKTASTIADFVVREKLLP